MQYSGIKRLQRTIVACNRNKRTDNSSTSLGIVSELHSSAASCHFSSIFWLSAPCFHCCCVLGVNISRHRRPKFNEPRHQRKQLRCFDQRLRRPLPRPSDPLLRKHPNLLLSVVREKGLTKLHLPNHADPRLRQRIDVPLTEIALPMPTCRGLNYFLAGGKLKRLAVGIGLGSFGEWDWILPTPRFMLHPSPVIDRYTIKILPHSFAVFDTINRLEGSVVFKTRFAMAG